ncbi:MAG TPA: DUF2000 domain-containing protein [Ktedonosporobacter sp.]|nr:DUF2000 domain-containing protein [Ktedonosporobacter sp.]
MGKPKCSIIVDGELPPGLLANTVGVIAMALGKLAPEAMGRDGIDQDGKHHQGLAWMGVTVLQGNKEVISDIFTRVGKNDTDLFVVDCPCAAQATRDYDEYLEMLSQQGGPELRLSGIGLYGNSKKIAKLTGNLPLLR